MGGPGAGVRAPSVRLFIALWPTPAVRAALAARRDSVGWPTGAAPVPDERLHLTLHFLGAVAIERLTALVPALAVPWPGCSLALGDPARWPHGLVVLPAHRPPLPLLELHQRLADRLAGLGLPVEQRAFRPHVTLARRAEGAQLPAPAPALRWRPADYALVRSDAVTGYHVLARYGARGITIPPPKPKAASVRRK
jgi:RNA 2',3'-cyclic 3'-phosphodiesterase